MQFNQFQLEKISGYFIDLAKVWFASGVIGFFISEPARVFTIKIAVGSAVISLLFLAAGLWLLSFIKP